MNAVILPGVVLGDHTIVGAGAVVTKSFPEGYCIIAGVPAKVIKTIDKDRVVNYRNKYEYYGYIPKEKFRRKYMDKS
jgi:acetyltransferase-like isoleucine patch superfamily enzyme